MKIVVLEASGVRKGSSSMLAGEFARGAEEAGHEVERIRLTRVETKPCLGCQTCAMDGDCVNADGFEKTIKPALREADLIAFAMPVYYYGWPAQAVAVVDRFYSFNTELRESHKKTVLLAVAWDNTPLSFEVTQAFYDKVVSYMGFEDSGRVIGIGCGTPEITAASDYPEKAYRLGRSL